jgi:cytochrome P450
MSKPPRPPGPRGRLISGNLSQYVEDPLGFMTQCAHQYGDVVALGFGPKPVVVLNHPDLIEYVLVTGNRSFKKDFTIQLYRPFLGNGLLTSEGDFWLRQRRLAQPAFQRQRSAGYGEAMVAYTERMLAGWRDGETRDLHADLMGLTLDIAARTLFGIDMTGEAHRVGEALADGLEGIDNRFSGLLFPPLWVPTANNRRIHRARRTLDEILYRKIEEKRRSGEMGDDLLSILLHARDEDDGSRMTDLQLRDEAMTLLLAGHETTALALSWTWYLLALYPEVEEELEAELQAVLGGHSPTVADLPRLRYTEQVITEAMRLYPPAYGQGREAIHDCTIGGYQVHRGTTIFFFQCVLHRDGRYFDHPDEFRPGRWADGLAQRLPKYAYFPFGGGPRMCIGNTFALMETALVLATVAQRFRMRLVPGHAVTPWPSITLRPRHGIKVTLEKREYSEMPAMPSFPNSVWERAGETPFREMSGAGETEFRGVRSQTEFGNEGHNER